MILNEEAHRNSEKILAVGGSDNIKAEWLDVTRKVWESLPDYPMGMSFIYLHDNNAENRLKFSVLNRI